MEEKSNTVKVKTSSESENDEISFSYYESLDASSKSLKEANKERVKLGR